jgi:thiol-disulfide isomerase/thioredoxin
MGLLEARFFHPYYLLNVASVVCWWFMRQRLSPFDLAVLENRHTWTGMTKEQEVFALCAVAIVSKVKQFATADHFLKKFFFFGKAAVCIVLYYLPDKNLLLWYLGLQALLFLAFAQPRYHSSSGIEDLSSMQFEDDVRGAAKSDTKSWIVFFHADWCEESRAVEPMFDHLALACAGKDRIFSRLDVVAYPHIAQDMNINMSSTATKQLPTIALFRAGREICRLPPFDSSGNVVRTRLDQKGVTSYFELDKEPGTESYTVKKKASKGDKKKKK